MLKVTNMIVDTMSSIPTSSSLRVDHADVFQALKTLRSTFGAYGKSTPRKDDELGSRSHDLESWTRFFVGLRTELPEFTARIRDVVEQWED